MVVAMDCPIAATSANLSGQGDIFVCLDKAIADIGNDVDLIIDAGATPAQHAASADRVNTIIDLTFESPYLVRPGWVGLEQVRKYFPTLRTDVEEYRRLLAQRAREVALT
jgi:L-threonylcarbamoyladenylate synthase